MKSGAIRTAVYASAVLFMCAAVCEGQIAGAPFFDGFESGSLSNAWSPVSTGYGRIRVISSSEPASGTYHACLDSSSAGQYGLNELVLTADLAGESNVHFSCAVASFGEETEWMPSQFSGSTNADGIAVSDDGTNWHKVLQLPFASTSPYTNIVIDISSFAAANGLTLNSQFKIKLQQYDNYSIPTDGICFDNVWLYDAAASADLEVQISDSGDPDTVGSNVTYTVVVFNNGPAASADAAVTNVLPAGAVFVSATTSHGTCTQVGSIVSCDLGTLDPASAATVSVTVTASSEGILTNQASVATSVLDPDASNNADSETTLIDLRGGDIQFLDAAYGVEESHGTLQILVSRTNRLYGEVTVDYGSVDGGATAGSDFLFASGTLVFSNGVSEQLIEVNILNDSANEPTESFSVVLSNAMYGAAVSSPGTAVVSIRDNDGVASFPFDTGFESGGFSNYWDIYSLDDGVQVRDTQAPHGGTRHVAMESGATLGNYFQPAEMTLTVDLSGRSGVYLGFWHRKQQYEWDDPMSDLFSNREWSDGVAISTDGVIWNKAQGLTFAEGASTNYQYFEVYLDDLVASNALTFTSTFMVRFQEWATYVWPWYGVAFDDIRLFGKSGKLRFGATNYLAAESRGICTIEVVRVEGAQGEISVAYSATNGSAVAGIDYTPGTGTLVFAEGVLSQSFAVVILDNHDDETDRAVDLTLFDATGGAVLASPSNAVLTILDDDGPGAFRFSSQLYSVGEEAGTAVVTVVRSGGTNGVVSVDFATMNGTAIAGSDYSATNGTLTFANGVESGTLRLIILDDFSPESNETFTVSLSNPIGGATLGSPTTAVFTIVDDELSCFQGFEDSPEDNWDYVEIDGAAVIQITTLRSRTGTHSLRLTGSNSQNADPYIEFQNVDISGHVNVRLSVGFSASGPDVDDDLYLDISYDNGVTWNGEGTIKLVDGYSNANIPFDGTHDSDPGTVSTNPYVVNVPDDKTQIAVRLRFDEKSGSNASIDDYFVDDVRLFFIPSGQPPSIEPVLDAEVAVSNLLTFTVTAAQLDSDLVVVSASNLPPGAVFNPATNLVSVTNTFTFIPSLAQADMTYTTTFFAVDDDGGDAESVIITVRDKVVRFTSSKSSVEEGEDVTLAAFISRAADAVVHIGSSGRAIQGSDFTFSATTLTFSASGTTQLSFAVSATDDLAPEGPEVTSLSLAPTGDAYVPPTNGFDLCILDNDSFTLASANLTSGGLQYRDAGMRILKSLNADIIGIQEWVVTNAGGHREFVDLVCGTNYGYYVESGGLPNGVISRWPITASGEWDDPLLSDRDFAWATIDIPGSKELTVVSVHFYFSGGAGQREDEARSLTNYLAQAGFGPDDLVVMCGDLNSQTRGEAVVNVLTNVLTDERKPADQFDIEFTNQNRDKPYDYVMPNGLLNGFHLPLHFEGEEFAEGMVFDTRLWANPPDPVRTNDSGSALMQHMAVMKLFSVGGTLLIDVQAGPNGMVSPPGAVVPFGSNVTFVVAADEYYEIASVRTNGLVSSGAPGHRTYTNIWTNITANGLLQADFAERLAVYDTPHWWLATHGWTSDFDNAATADVDNDGHQAWQEFRAKTGPTDSSSVLRITGQTGSKIRWSSESNVTYIIHKSTNQFSSFTTVESGISATPSENVFTDGVQGAESAIYWIEVDW
ncbi:MAG: DUF11 domain-containing protein [Verrucomicrobia bacterium]|nr:DUF11 domain-containing protein [Verrucomicrobiota bacterium]